MKRILTFALPLLFVTIPLHFLAGPVYGQACNSGAWTQTSQQPSSCVPYAMSGLFAIPLPNAGSGGPTDHLATNSDTIAAYTLTNNGAEASADYGQTQVATPGTDDHRGVPMYYGTSSDPIYKVNACSTNCGVMGNASYALNTFWHIPDQAHDNQSSDPFFLVWDQTNNKILGIYNSITLPHCTAATEGTACNTGDVSRGQKSDYTNDADYQYTNGGFNSLFNADMAGIVRHREWMDGTIGHALYLNTLCEEDGSVFPAQDFASYGQALTCSGAGIGGDHTKRPKHGTLFFLDYTDAQIDAMNLPAWQKPLVVAMAHYGGYVGDTNGGGGFQLNASRFESGLAYTLNGGTASTLYAWLEGQGISCIGPGGGGGSTCRYSIKMLGGIPNVGGTGVASHLHIADECVPKGMLGLAGGCASGPPPAITVTTPVSGSIQRLPATVSVNWNLTNISSGTDFALTYSFDGFVTSYSIATGVSWNATPYTFTPEWPASDTMQIKVCHGATCGISPTFKARGQYLK